MATQQAIATAHHHQPTTTATAHNPKYNSKQNQTNPAKYPKQIHLQKNTNHHHKNSNHHYRITTITTQNPLTQFEKLPKTHHYEWLKQHIPPTITINPTQLTHKIKARKIKPGKPKK